MRAPFPIFILLLVLYISLALCARPKATFVEQDPATKGLTKHHIIPGNTLHRFFSVAVAESKKDANIEAELKTSILHIANGIKGNGLDHHAQKALKAIKKGHMNLDNEKGYAFSLFFWMPANIFMGPSPDCRKYDPRSGFEERAQYIIRDQGTFNTLTNIYMDMEQYVKTKDRRYFNAANTNLRTLNNYSPYKYDQQQWIWDTNQKCEIKTTGSPSGSRPGSPRQSSSTGNRG